MIFTKETQANINKTFYAADVSTINAGATYSTPSDVISTDGVDFCTVWLTFTGANASSSGSVTFNIVASYDGTTFATQAITDTPAGTLSANNAVVSKPFMIDCRGGIKALKVLSIVNGDATYDLSSVNARLVASQ